MRLRLIGCMAVILSACSSGPAPIYQPVAPQGDPPTKTQIAAGITEIFAESVHPTDILATPARPATERGLFGWLVCVRARVVGISGADAGFQTIAVFYQRQHIVLRRRAEPDDKCDGFERLST